MNYVDVKSIYYWIIKVNNKNGQVGLQQMGRFDIKDLIYSGNEEHNHIPMRGFGESVETRNPIMNKLNAKDSLFYREVPKGASVRENNICLVLGPLDDYFPHVVRARIDCCRCQRLKHRRSPNWTMRSLIPQLRFALFTRTSNPYRYCSSKVDFFTNAFCDSHWDKTYSKYIHTYRVHKTVIKISCVCLKICDKNLQNPRSDAGIWYGKHIIIDDEKI